MCGRITRPLHQDTVLGQVGQTQMQAVATLLRTLQVAWSSQLEVLFGYLKTVGGVGHHLHAAAHVGSCRIAGHQYAPRLVTASAHPATQLVQL